MEPSDWRYTVGVVSGGHFFSHLYILTLPPLFPLMRADFGWGPAKLGIIISVLSFGGLLQPIVGSMVDRMGAKRLMVGGLVLTGTSLGLIGVANSLLVVIVFAFFSGIGQSVFHPADYAIIDAVTTESTKGKSFSVHMLAGYIGFATAPIMVGTLGLTYGWRTALFTVGFIGSVYAIVSTLTVEPAYLKQLTEAPIDTSDVNLDNRLRVFLRPATIILFGMFLMATIANKSIQSFTGLLFLDGFGLSETAGNNALTAFFAAASVGIIIGGVLADRLSPRKVFGTMVSIGALVLAIGTTLRGGLVQPLAVGLFGVVGCCYGLALPSRDRLVNSIAPTGSTGRTFGFIFAGISLGGVVGPASVGALIEATSVVTGFYVVAASFAAAVALVVLLGTRLVPMNMGHVTSND